MMSQPLTLRRAITHRLRAVGAARGVVAFLRQNRTGLVETLLNIETVCPPGRFLGSEMATHYADAVEYLPMDYGLLWKYMRPVSLEPDDVVFDIGCGMGRVLCAFARRRVRKCVGIEFDAELAEIARANGRALRGRRARIEIRTGDAREADYAEGTVFWFHNPFGERTMAAVLDRIHQSLVASPRHIQLVYVRPVHENLLRSRAWLARTAVLDSAVHQTGAASYWENRLGRPRAGADGADARSPRREKA
jgi:predicted RNA methylase